MGPQGTISSQWDLAGRRTRLTYPGNGLYLDYDYLVTGETLKIRENGATSGIGVLATYGYDDLGRRTSLTFGNGAAQAYGYDPVSRLASLTNNLTGTANDLSQALTYSPASQIASNTRTGDAYAWTAHYNENRNYTANGLNQFTGSGAITPTYDSKGNLTSAGTTTYAYSSENLLTSASGGTSASLAYDPALRLYQLTSGASTTRFAYDGLDLIAEYDGSNNLLRRYVHGPGEDEPIAWYEGTGTTNRRFPSSDERGSVISVTDGSGTVLGLNSYDEFGIPQSTNIGRFQYTGQAWLPELGMQYSKARIYSPALGRFLQTDPIDVAGGINLYAYVRNDPVNWVDPTGLDACPDGSGDICVKGKRIHVDAPTLSGGAGLLGGHSGGLGASGGDGGGGGGSTDTGEPPLPPEPPACERARAASTSARARLPARVTTPRAWNDPASLRYFQMGYQYNASDLNTAGLALAFASPFAAFIPGGKAVQFGIGSASSITGFSLMAWQSQYERMVADIQARLDQLQLQQEGTCK